MPGVHSRMHTDSKNRCSFPTLLIAAADTIAIAMHYTLKRVVSLRIALVYTFTRKPALSVYSQQ